MKKFSGINVILVISMCIIVTASLEALMMVKSVQHYREYVNLFGETAKLDYVSAVMLFYLYKIMSPVIIALYSYFCVNRVKIGALYKIVFGIMAFVPLIMAVLSFKSDNIFSFIGIMFSVMFFVAVLRFEGKKGW